MIDRRPIYQDRTISYLGPAGSFSETAARKLQNELFFGLGLQHSKSIRGACEMVYAGKAEMCVTPIENNSDGDIDETMKAVLELSGLFINGEIVLPIPLAFFHQKGVSPQDIRTVVSRPTALRQATIFLSTNYSHARQEGIESTSGGLMRVTQDSSVGAVASPNAAEDLGLASQLERTLDIANNRKNATRFLTLSLKPEHGDLHDPKTTFLLRIANRPGGLAAHLQTLYERGINMTQIKSIGENMDYADFFMTINGNGIDPKVEEVFETYYQLGSALRMLGSYETASYRPTIIPKNQPEIDLKSLSQTHGLDKKQYPGRTRVVYMVHNRPGALLASLQPFARRGVNLRNIGSTQTGHMDTYAFYLEFEENVQDQEALIAELEAQSTQLHIL